MDDKEDPVEHEIDVFLSRSLAENLYLLQYPVRPSHMTYDSVEHLSTRVKPNQKKVELELALNTNSPHYAKSKGEQIALNVDGHKESAEPSYYASSVMDKQVLTSVPSSANTERYAVGYLKDGELHLSPLHALVQLRPSFGYLDRVDDRQKVVQQGGGEEGESSQDEVEEEAKPVTIKFARPESAEAKARRLASFEYLNKKREEERWVNVDYYGIYDDRSDMERELLIAGKGDQSSAEFNITPKDYLQMLMPLSSEDKQEKPAMPNNVLSLSQLKTMPLGDQVKALLVNAKVIQFHQLINLLPKGTDPQATLRSLQHVAVMVQGCWVVKSDVLYPKEVCSPHSGISAEYLCRGRDYVIWRFTQSRFVTRKEVATVTKLPSEDILDILKQMSHIRVHQGWEFGLEYDYDFTNRYPEITQRQKMLWEAKQQAIFKQLNISREQEKKIRDQAALEAAEDKPRRRRRSSSRSSRKRTLSGRSISDHSDVEIELPKQESLDVEPIFIDGDNGIENMEVNHISNGPTMELSAEGMSTLNSVSYELRAELLKFVQEKLYSRFVLSISELKRLFTVKLSTCPPGHILGSGVSEKLLEEAVIAVGGIVLNAQWQTEHVYVLSKTGGDLDTIRGILVDFLKSSHKVNKKSFAKLVESSLGTSPSDNDVKIVLRDYCVPKFGSWYIKCCSDWS
ncbi:hypothetical protein CHS0354_019221 [Potamilus streckersoni]|uniref:DNA-directed RNA polymerase III subunit RPC5 C-terminal domain-containing protein n=1 Tax=Potamilus streckersoni TaxID=2493646 RepID=A0AAE0T012_9BIVA|nr:hypothetical protein CHS0354_019221 [Potamilus streckersoni]